MEEAWREDPVAGGELPPALYNALEGILQRPAEEQDSALDRLANLNREHRATLWREVARARNLTELAPEFVPIAFGEPATIGKYRVVSKLKTGGMGRVYLAEDQELGRRVALKTLRPELLAFEVVRRRFQREMSMLSRLEHPSICRLYEVGIDRGLPFMALEFVDGVDLDTLLRDRREGRTSAPGGTTSSLLLNGYQDGRQEVQNILRFFEEVCRALHFAHEHGLVHRDLKPANLMVRRSGLPVILDFGLALELQEDHSRLSLSGERLGTPAFMSPEQLAGGAQTIDRRTDVWALGVTLFEALTRRLPFEGPTREDTVLSIRTLQPPSFRRLNPAVSRDLEVVVHKALEKDPRRRYGTAQEFADDLHRVLAKEPVSARRAGPVLRAQRWVQRNPRVAVLLCTLSIGLVFSTWQFRRAETQATVATERQTRFDLLATLIDLDRLEAEATELYPPWPSSTERMRRWLESERTQPRSEADIEQALEQLEAAPFTADQTRTTVDRFLRETLSRLLPRLREIKTTTRDRVREDLLWSEQIEWLSIGRFSEQWAKAAASIGSSRIYASHPIDLRPQLDLVPIGENPRTGLWEFYHLRSAWDSVAMEDPAAIAIPAFREDGSLPMSESNGMVFVLVPGGSVTMGVQPDNAMEPNYEPDPQPEHWEEPLNRVELEPFFLSRYEMTQGQWARLSRGSRPSFHSLDKPEYDTLDFKHPVESVSREACVNLLKRFSLELPTEAQWEYACRAGTTTRWFTGDAVDSLAAYANIADQRALRFGAPWRTGFAPFDDGAVIVAQVDYLLPNPFGFYGMSGNVIEWCRDPWGWYTDPVEPGTGLRLPRHYSARGVARGGSFQAGPWHARSAARHERFPMIAEGDLGLRAARVIQQPGQ